MEATAPTKVQNAAVILESSLAFLLSWSLCHHHRGQPLGCFFHHKSVQPAQNFMQMEFCGVCSLWRILFIQPGFEASFVLLCASVVPFRLLNALPWCEYISVLFIQPWWTLGLFLVRCDCKWSCSEPCSMFSFVELTGSCLLGKPMGEILLGYRVGLYLDIQEEISTFKVVVLFHTPTHEYARVPIAPHPCHH